MSCQDALCIFFHHDFKQWTAWSVLYFFADVVKLNTKVTKRDDLESQFAYCPLIWMSPSRELNNKINRLHKRALRIVYQDNDLSLEELLQKDNSVSIHHRNIQLVAIVSEWKMKKYMYVKVSNFPPQANITAI